MRELALFAGAGGGLLASRMLGWTTVCAVESDPYARRVLRARQADGTFEQFPIERDVREFDGNLWYTGVDVVSGGFPCQPFSTASRGRRVAEDLWPEMLRVVREVEPKYVFAENVQRAPIQRAADDLAGLGFMVRCARVSSASLGAAHRRPRYWLVATDPNVRGQCAKPVHEEVARVCDAATAIWSRPPVRGILGVDDGATGRTHRMRCVGNAQSPQVAALAWSRLVGSPAYDG